MLKLNKLIILFEAHFKNIKRIFLLNYNCYYTNLFIELFVIIIARKKKQYVRVFTGIEKYNAEI